MRDKFVKYLFEISVYFEEKRMFQAIKKGFIMTIPIIIIGAFAIVLEYMPITLYQDFIVNFADGKIHNILELINRSTLGVLSLCMVLTISYSYSELCCKNRINNIILPIVSMSSYMIILGITNSEFSIEQFSQSGMFTAIFISVISSKLFIKIISSKIFNKLDHINGVDSVFEDSIKGIIPAAIIIIFFLIIWQIINIFFGEYDLQSLFADIADKIFNQIESNLFAGILYMFLVQGMFFLGIHGSNVLSNIAYNSFESGIGINNVNIMNGMEPSQIITKTSIDTYVNMGGAGAIVCLVIAIYLFSKKKELKKLCKLGSIPVIFNISEIMYFGLPIVLNPIFIIPFILIPILFTLISYFAMYFSLIPLTIQSVEWTTPIIISGYVATGSIKGSIMQVILIIIGVLIYKPFIKIYDEKIDLTIKNNINKLTSMVKEAEGINNKTEFLSRNDQIGRAAKLLLGDLKNDIKDNKLFLVYQPQVDEKGRIIGVEALLRWKHPIGGEIYPPLIIEIAKEGKILSKLENLIFSEAGKSLKELNEKVSSSIKLSVNITAESLLQNEFEEMIDSTVNNNKLNRKNLWIEITEHDALLNLDSVEEKLLSLKNKGHKIIIDDFGMGHTSLKYLQNYNFDVIKLDGSITKNIEANKRNSDIISSIVFLSKDLDFTIISECVETSLQRDKLLELGCNVFQGYYYCKPVLLQDLLNKIDTGFLVNIK